LLKTSGTSCSSGLPVISALTVSNITPFAAASTDDGQVHGYAGRVHAPCPAAVV
jgi:hypothetical protein